MASDCDLMVVVPSLGVGGTEQQVVLLTRGLIELDPTWSERLVVVTMVDGGALEDALAPGTRVVRLGLTNSFDPRAVLRLRRQIRRMRPALVYTMLVPANVAGALATPLLMSTLVWGHRSERLTQGVPRWRQALTRLILRVLVRRARAVIVNSRAAARFVRGLGVRDTRIALVENAVDTARFRPDRSLRDAGRAGLGLAPDRCVVLSVGRLVAEKDHPTLLRAFARIRAQRENACLVLAGGGDETAVNELRRLANSLGVRDQIILLGHRSDVEVLYNVADVVVQSSVNEGFSNVLTEALASAVACVSTDCGDARWVLPADRVVAIGDDIGLAVATLAALDAGPSPRPTRFVGPTDLAAATLETLDRFG